MGDEVEARAQCVCDHLHRPDHPDWKLTDAKVRSTENRTVPGGELRQREAEIDRKDLVENREKGACGDVHGGIDNPKSTAWDGIGAAYWNQGYDGGPSPEECDLYLRGVGAGDPVLLVGASTVRLALATVERGAVLTVADFSSVQLSQLGQLLHCRAEYVLADVTRSGALAAEAFRVVLADRLINRFTIPEMAAALGVLSGTLRAGGELRLSYRLGLYDRDHAVLAEARRRGDLAAVYDEQTSDIDYGGVRTWLGTVLPPHGAIPIEVLVQFYSSRGREHRLRQGELDVLVQQVAASRGLELSLVQHRLPNRERDYILRVTRLV